MGRRFLISTYGLNTSGKYSSRCYFFSLYRFEGGKSYNIEMSLDQIPLFVKEDTILPLAKPVQYVTPITVFEISCHMLGDNCKPTQLFENNSKYRIVNRTQH